MKAYHFVGKTLRDGKPIPDDGEKLIYDGTIELCRSGYHASLHVFDALQYAPASTLCLVDCGGEIIKGDDKIVCSERTIIKRIDADELLREFARKCALDVVDLWDAPDNVVEYLKTGRDDLRASARDAAWDSAWDAAAAAYSASARASARDAAWDSARKKQRIRLSRMVNKAFKGVNDK